MKGLAVADPDPVAPHIAIRHLKVLADPVDVFGRDSDAAAREAFMAMAFSDVDGVGVDIGRYHEYGILVPTDVEAFPLADGVELRSVMLANDLAPWVVLVVGLLDVFLAAAIDFRLELYRRIINRFRQPYPIFVA